MSIGVMAVIILPAHAGPKVTFKNNTNKYILVDHVVEKVVDERGGTVRSATIEPRATEERTFLDDGCLGNANCKVTATVIIPGKKQCQSGGPHGSGPSCYYSETEQHTNEQVQFTVSPAQTKFEFFIDFDTGKLAIGDEKANQANEQKARDKQLKEEEKRKEAEKLDHERRSRENKYKFDEISLQKKERMDALIQINRKGAKLSESDKASRKNIEEQMKQLRELWDILSKETNGVSLSTLELKKKNIFMHQFRID